MPNFDTKYYKFWVELTLNNQLKKKCQKTYIDMIKIILKLFTTLKYCMRFFLVSTSVMKFYTFLASE
jgi:hypothetical protein